MNIAHLELLLEDLKWLRDAPELPEGTAFSIDDWGRTRQTFDEYARLSGCETVMCLAGWHAFRHQDLGITLSPEGGIHTPTCRNTLHSLSKHFDLGINLIKYLFLEVFYPRNLTWHSTRQDFAKWAIPRVELLLGHPEKSEDALISGIGQLLWLQQQEADTCHQLEEST